LSSVPGWLLNLDDPRWFEDDDAVFGQELDDCDLCDGIGCDRCVAGVVTDG